MEHYTNPEQPEKITSEYLKNFARERPAQDPETKALLLKWIEETELPEESGLPSLPFLNVAIMHTAMQYRLGFISRTDALEILEEVRKGVNSEVKTPEIEVLHTQLCNLMYDIEDGLFDVIHQAQE